MVEPVRHPNEPKSNEVRGLIGEREPVSLRTYTPSQLVISRSSGVYHWTADGRKLYDYTSGVLVANLGHNPSDWQKKLFAYMGWSPKPEGKFFEAVPLTAYNAITNVEAEAVRRLTANLQSTPYGRRLDQVLWAASGSEAIQKALWASLALDPSRDVILATCDGFHGKKGLAEAVTGNENDKNRDPRVRFISFPKEECRDLAYRNVPFNPAPYAAELEKLSAEFGGKAKGQRGIACLITEPYLGGGGSYHPPKAYLQLLQDFCRQNDAVFILDEIQSNFGRSGKMYAFEAYGLEPDVVVLGKGLANGVPGAAAVGRKDVFASLSYGEGSDTYSANPLCCGAVLASLDSYEQHGVLANVRKVSPLIEAGLVKLKDLPFVKFVRGEPGGMVWGVEIGDFGGKPAGEVANDCVLAAYRGDEKGRGVHLLGPLAKKVIRIAPPLVITEAEAKESLDVLSNCLHAVERQLAAKVGAGGP